MLPGEAGKLNWTLKGELETIDILLLKGYITSLDFYNWVLDANDVSTV